MDNYDDRDAYNGDRSMICMSITTTKPIPARQYLMELMMRSILTMIIRTRRTKIIGNEMM